MKHRADRMRAPACSVSARIGLLGAALLLSACVSDTISQNGTGSAAVSASSGNAVFDPAQRDDAIAEIRAKAAQPGSGQLTNAYADGDGPTAPMSPSEQSASIFELEQAARRNSATLDDPELAEKQRSIRQLQAEGRSHYSNAVQNIQN